MRVNRLEEDFVIPRTLIVDAQSIVEKSKYTGAIHMTSSSVERVIMELMQEYRVYFLFPENSFSDKIARMFKKKSDTKLVDDFLMGQTFRAPARTWGQVLDENSSPLLTYSDENRERLIQLLGAEKVLPLIPDIRKMRLICGKFFRNEEIEEQDKPDILTRIRGLRTKERNRFTTKFE